MVFAGVCFAPLNPLLLSPRRPKPSTSNSFSSRNPKKITNINKSPNNQIPSINCLSKRKLNLSIVALILSVHLPAISKATSEELKLQRYIDSNVGFTLLIPSSWIKVDKAGATVLFEEANKGANNVGVVVNPVRLTNLGEFGTPRFVADKLIEAEKRKESTKDAEVIAFTERSGQGGLQVYEFEYKVDSTRGGMKRIFSAAFVSSKKLYLLNITHSDKPESPLDTDKRMMLEKVLHSFDAAPLT
ncbi:psbP domain-containing protein 2, chloroplastic-like [Cornus florida]|uniref:psbP domain-containing protein 2, chloroplastic-like n=1 Tax=Cornus florida TaxID=4283 RepID=UPI002899C0D9|nr:psbP domain-containing protein 2, chloroplastic-like [Cornus florida]